MRAQKPIPSKPVVVPPTEEAIDSGIEESFPASDPVSVTVSKVPAKSSEPKSAEHTDSHTKPQQEGGSAPRLPHERDESSDSHASEPREVMKQAQRDVERGLVDTDRGPVMDKLYEDKVRPAGGKTRDRAAPDGTGG